MSKLLDLYFDEETSEKISKIDSNGVTFEMLSEGQKMSFIGITKLIHDNLYGSSGAKEGVIDIFQNPKRHITLNSPAGCGKTTLSKFIVEYIKMIGFADVTLACAPNHNARKVLSSFSGLKTFTIHKLLGIRPDNYQAERKFKQSKLDGGTPIDSCRILLVDEVSFIDRDLFNILMKDIPRNCIIIGMGNKDQLKPISNMKDGEAVPDELSPFFTDHRFYQFELTEIKRSKSPVTLVGEAIRQEKFILPSKSYIDDEGNGVHIVKNISEFLSCYFDKVKSPEDFKNNRVVAFSNEHVDQMNWEIRTRIYNTKEPFVDGEILVAQSPFIEDDHGFEKIIFDNGTYVEVCSTKEFIETISVPEVPYEIEVKAFEVIAKELDVFFEEEDGVEYKINILHPDSKDLYKKFIEDYRSALSNIKYTATTKPDWKTFYKFLDKKFLDVKYLPVCTVHKSQGITVDNLFYYVSFVKNMGDKDFARRLSYVAVTRARYNTFILI